MSTAAVSQKFEVTVQYKKGPAFLTTVTALGKTQAGDIARRKGLESGFDETVKKVTVRPS